MFCLERNGEEIGRLSVAHMNPLGVPHSVGVVEAYVLVHPERVLAPEKALSLFADVAEGQEVALMASWPDALVQRGASVARTALVRSKLKPEQEIGGLLVYCAGCMLSISDRASEMLSGLQAVLGDAPTSRFSPLESRAVSSRGMSTTVT